MTNTQNALTYGSPEHKARIKELKAQQNEIGAQLREINNSITAHWAAQREINPEYRSWYDESDELKTLQSRHGALLAPYRAVERERLELQTHPLPCEVHQLPCRVIDNNDDTLEKFEGTPEIGQTVALYSRGRVRLAAVVKVGKSNAEVAYTTPSSPNHVTRKTVKFVDLYKAVN